MPDKKEFTEWLNKKLRELNADENVFGEYIISILEDDDTADERQEALEGILSAMIETDLDKVVAEIINEWDKCQPKATATPAAPAEDIETKLAKLLESQQLATTVQRQYTDEELRIREQILSQYSQVEYEDEYDEDDDDGAGPSGDSLMKNTNASDVAQLAKEKREQAKIDSQAKKDKDKEDRAKQKQQREEKKEKRKTVKGERRR